MSYYNSQLSQPLNDFVLYVSMIYHYSQKEVPDLIFRNLFKKDGTVIGLQKYLRSHYVEEQALYKILSNVTDEAGKQTLWRPRYARFADAVLQSVCSVGGWKEMAYESSINLINSIKSNQQYLVDDSRQILISVFLERGKEELLGVEEAWSKDNNTHFHSCWRILAIVNLISEMCCQDWPIAFLTKPISGAIWHASVMKRQAYLSILMRL